MPKHVSCNVPRNFPSNFSIATSLSQLNAQSLKSLSPMAVAVNSAIFSLMLVATQASLISPANAQTIAAAKQTYNIPAGSLSKVLSQFAAESGVLLSADASLAEGKLSKGLQGSYTVENGFTLLLTGTELEVIKSTSGYKIAKKISPVKMDKPDKPDKPEYSTLPEVSVSTNTEKETASGPVNGYRAKRTATATLTDPELRDIPQSVTVISQELIRDQANNRIEDIAINVPGVQSTAPYVGASTIGFNARGFGGGRYLLDGFATTSYLPSTDLSNIERVEFLRGPAGVLFGYGTPGGIANIVTKRPGKDNFNELPVAVDRFGQRRIMLDYGDALGSDALLARLNMALEDSNTYRDFASKKRIFIAPSFTLKTSDKTEINLDLTYDKFRYFADRGFGYDPALIKLFERQGDASKNLSEPNLQQSQAETGGVRIDLKQQFSDNWSLRIGGFHFENEVNQYEIGTGALEADGHTVDRYYNHYYGGSGNRTKNTSLFIHLKGKLATAAIQHELLLGLQRDRLISPYATAHLADDSSFSSIDFFNPSYLAKVPVGDLFKDFGSNNLDSKAVYLQDMMSVSDQWKVLAGLRRDQFVNTGNYTDSSGVLYPSDAEGNKTSSRIGVVWQPGVQTSVYASAAQSFNPNQGRNRTGAGFKPEDGIGYELGLKQDLTPNASLTAAVFDITKKNVLTPDPVDPDFSVISGKQQSQGIEITINGRIAGYTEISASAAHLFKYAITQDNNPAVQGRNLTGAAENTASVWAKHNLSSIGWRGWSVAGGLFYAGQRDTSLYNNLSLPGYTRVDAAVYYDTGKWALQANLRNLTDRMILQTNDGGGLVVPEEPRNLRVTVSYRF